VRIRKGLLTRKAARADLDNPIANHRFRISVELYQEALRQFRMMRSSEVCLRV
jgi:hypothetical protein